MDKKGSALRNFLVLLFVVFLFSSIVAGGYSYHVISRDRQRIAQKDREIERLNQSANLLASKLSEAEASRKKTETEFESLRSQSRQYEAEKRIIIDQVRSAVANFDTYRQQASGEIDQLKNSIASLESEKNDLSGRLTSAENLSKKEKEDLSSQIKDLNEKIETHKKDEETLAKQLEDRQKTAIMTETVKLHYNLGNFYFKNRQYKAAAEEYAQAAYFAPDDASSHFNLAVTSEEYLGDPITALAHYKKYLELAPDSKDFQLIQRHVFDLEADRRILDTKAPKEKPMEIFTGDRK